MRNSSVPRADGDLVKSSPAASTTGRRLPPTPPAVWQDPEVIAACQARDFGTVLHLWRTHPSRRERLTQRGLAAAVGPISQSAISRIEKGELRVDRITDLQRWFSIIGLPAHLGWVGDYVRVSGPHPPIPAQAHEDWRSWQAPSSLTDDPLTPAGPTPLLPGRAGRYEASLLLAETRRIRAMDHSYGGRSVLVLARANHARAHHYLGSTPAESARSPLLVAAAEAAANTAWILLDAGAVPAARERLREAVLLAREAQSTELEVYAVTNYIAMAWRTDGKPSEALSLLSRAHQIAPRLASHRLLAHLFYREAQYRVKLGERSTVLTLLRLAEARMEQGVTDNDPGWLEFWSEHDMRRGAARLLTTLGDVRADQAFTLATELHRPEMFGRNTLLVGCELVTLALAWGEVERACALGHWLADNAPPHIDSWLVEKTLHALLVQLSKVDSPLARDVLAHWREVGELSADADGWMTGSFYAQVLG